MRLLKNAAIITHVCHQYKQSGRSIGFVPTMGALHQGHISLIQESRKKADVTVCSIFVNPTQFNDKEDLKKYPRTTEQDIQLLYEAGCDIVFLPDVQEIYPTGYKAPHYPLKRLEDLWEGQHRPGHFQGVCQVVDRLFTLIMPDYVFFGQKDYQQCLVIKELLRQVPAYRSITMLVTPTLRESSGLAMSSRNARLTEAQKNIAPTLYHTLQYLQNHLQPGDPAALLQQASERLIKAGFKPDYVAIADADTLEPVKNWNGQTGVVALAAAFLGEIRLIDNLIINH